MLSILLSYRENELPGFAIKAISAITNQKEKDEKEVFSKIFTNLTQRDDFKGSSVNDVTLRFLSIRLVQLQAWGR